MKPIVRLRFFTGFRGMLVPIDSPEGGEARAWGAIELQGTIEPRATSSLRGLEVGSLLNTGEVGCGIAWETARIGTGRAARKRGSPIPHGRSNRPVSCCAARFERKAG